MRRHFGTDGIRGIANKELSCGLAFNCGNALTFLKPNVKVVIGKDSRISGDLLKMSFSSGVLAGGGTVYDLGLMPTAGTAYLTKKMGADFGVVISASHNPKEYNGIKLFGSDGYKLSDAEEEKLESHIGVQNYVDPNEIQRAHYASEGATIYGDFLVGAVSCSLKGHKIVIDAANGAASIIAPEVFARLGASAVVINNDHKSGNINDNCGCLFPDVIQAAVREHKANMAVAFDGDSDRLIVCDANGNRVDGDKILYIIARYFRDNGLLKNNLVVGTLHTNMGIEKAIKRSGIGFERSKIGDRYVIEMMRRDGSILGGEQSGHIIIGDRSTTGDGILAALMLCEVLEKTGKTLAELADVEVYPQKNINVIVPDKKKILSNTDLIEEIKIVEKKMNGNGRVLVRASGTEPKIRIMTECENAELAVETAEHLANMINTIANLT